MDILKNLFKTTAAAMVLILFAACNFELKSDGSKPSPQKEEVPTEEPAKKEVAATYVNKDAAMFGVEMKIDFYTDGTWLAYDDVMDEEGASIALVGLYKGTYEGNASEDGTLKIKIANYSDAAKLIEADKMFELLTQLESKFNLETAELPVKYEVKWSAYENPEEKSCSVEKGKLTLLGGDFFRDGYTPDETETDPIDDPENDNPVEEPEVTKEIVARYLGYDDIGKVFIELYKDRSFLAYDEIYFGNDVLMLLDLYKGTYEGKPAEDGTISFNITHVSSVIGQSNANLIALMKAQQEEAGENAVYPMKVNSEWVEYPISATVIVKNGRTKVLGFDVVREGTEESGNSSEEIIDEVKTLFAAADCTKDVTQLSLSDGNWTMKKYLVSDNNGRIMKSMYSTILSNFTEPEQEMIHSWELSDEELEEMNLTASAEDYVFLKMPGRTISIKEYDFSVDKTQDGSDENKIKITKNVSTFILSTDGDVFVKKFNNITYDVYRLPRPEWKGNYAVIQTEQELNYDKDKGLISDMVISGSNKYEWKSDTEQVKIFGIEKNVKDENSIYIMKKE